MKTRTLVAATARTGVSTNCQYSMSYYRWTQNSWIQNLLASPTKNGAKKPADCTLFKTFPVLLKLADSQGQHPFSALIKLQPEQRHFLQALGQ